MSKILMVSEHFDRPTDTIPIGGVQRHISSVTRELTRRGHEVVWKYPTAEILPFDRVNSEWNVFFHDWSTFRNISTRTRTIVFHGWEGAYPPSPVIISKRKAILAQCDFSMCVGHYVEKHYGTPCTHVIYGGADVPPDFHRVDDGESFTVLFLGRLARDTEPTLSFWSFSRFVSMNKFLFKNRGCRKIKMVYAGDGDQRIALQSHAEAYLSRVGDLPVEVEFKGFVDNVWPLLGSADLVIPSGLLSCLESFHAGARTVVIVDPFVTPPIKQDYWTMMPETIRPEVVRVTDSENLFTSAFDEKFDPGFERRFRQPDLTEASWSVVADRYETCLR